MSDTPQIIEQTAKRWKLLQLIGLALAVVSAPGIPLSFARVDWSLWPLLIASATVFVAGAGICITGAALAWWYHG